MTLVRRFQFIVSFFNGLVAVIGSTRAFVAPLLVIDSRNANFSYILLSNIPLLLIA